MMATHDTIQAIFGDLRASLHRHPTQHNWIDVLAYLKRLREASGGKIASAHLRYVRDMLGAGWSDFPCPIWSDDVVWRYLENDPSDPIGELIRAVTIRHNAHGKRDVLRVLDSPFLSHLDRVIFDAYPETSEALARVLESDHLRELDEIRLENIALSLPSWPEILPGRSIERLTLHHCDIQGATVFALCDLVRRARVRELYIKPSHEPSHEEILMLLALPVERMTLLECGVGEAHLRAFDPDELPPRLDLGERAPALFERGSGRTRSDTFVEPEPRYHFLDEASFPLDEELGGREVVMTRDFAMTILEDGSYAEVGFGFRALLEQICEANEGHDLYIVR